MSSIGNKIQSSILREYPQIYFVVAGIVVATKVFHLSPAAMSWPLTALVVGVMSFLGWMGIQAKKKAAE